MANSFNRVYIHYVFSTKNRKPLIKPKYQKQLFGYLGGIARNNGFTLLQAGGVEDHIHLLISLPATITVSNAVKLLKGNSSRWMNEKFFNKRREKFQWQEGYGAFGIGQSSLDKTIQYIEDQEKHHKKMTFREEYIALLKIYQMEYDSRYVFG